VGACCLILMAVCSLDPSCGARRLPRPGSEVHVGEGDGEGVVHPLLLHGLLRMTGSAQGVRPPGVQRSDCLLEALRKQRQTATTVKRR